MNKFPILYSYCMTRCILLTVVSSNLTREYSREVRPTNHESRLSLSLHEDTPLSPERDCIDIHFVVSVGRTSNLHTHHTGGG